MLENGGFPDGWFHIHKHSNRAILSPMDLPHSQLQYISNLLTCRSLSILWCFCKKSLATTRTLPMSWCPCTNDWAVFTNHDCSWKIKATEDIKYFSFKEWFTYVTRFFFKNNMFLELANFIFLSTQTLVESWGGRVYSRSR